MIATLLAWTVVLTGGLYIATLILWPLLFARGADRVMASNDLCKRQSHPRQEIKGHMHDRRGQMRMKGEPLWDCLVNYVEGFF